MVMRVGSGSGGVGGFGRKDNDDNDKKKGNVNNNNKVKGQQDGEPEKKTEGEGKGRKNPLSGFGSRMRNEMRELANQAHARLGHGPSGGDIGNRLREAGSQAWGAVKVGAVLVPALTLMKVGSWLSKVGSGGIDPNLRSGISKQDISGPSNPVKVLDNGKKIPMEEDSYALPNFKPDPPKRNTGGEQKHVRFDEGKNSTHEYPEFKDQWLDDDDYTPVGSEPDDDKIDDFGYGASTPYNGGIRGGDGDNNPSIDKPIPKPRSGK